MNHTEIIQKLIDEKDYTSFLEIGYGTGANFNSINIKEKTSVDPSAVSANDDIHSLTSDEFFEQLDGRKKYDIIFIDGLHHADQVERDIVNSWRHLRKGGALVIHDVWPTNEEMTIVPRQTKQWTGDVYKAFDGLLQWYEINYELDKDDFGTATILFDKDIKVDAGFTSDVSFDEYKFRYSD